MGYEDKYYYRKYYNSSDIDEKIYNLFLWVMCFFFNVVFFVFYINYFIVSKIVILNNYIIYNMWIM